MQTASDTVEGWLLKQGAKGLRKGYKKRWFSLQANRLHYFENKGDPLAKSLGFIDILAASAVVPSFPTPSSTNSSTKSAGNCEFQVVTPQRVYALIAASEQEMKQWVADLDTQRQRLIRQSRDGQDAANLRRGSVGALSSPSSAFVAGSGRPQPPARRAVHTMTPQQGRQFEIGRRATDATTTVGDATPQPATSSPSAVSRELSGLSLQSGSNRRSVLSSSQTLTAVDDAVSHINVGDGSESEGGAGTDNTDAARENKRLKFKVAELERDLDEREEMVQELKREIIKDLRELSDKHRQRDDEMRQLRDELAFAHQKLNELAPKNEDGSDAGGAAGVVTSGDDKDAVIRDQQRQIAGLKSQLQERIEEEAVKMREKVRFAIDKLKQEQEDEIRKLSQQKLQTSGSGGDDALTNEQLRKENAALREEIKRVVEKMDTLVRKAHQLLLAATGSGDVAVAADEDIGKKAEEGASASSEEAGNKQADGLATASGGSTSEGGVTVTYGRRKVALSRPDPGEEVDESDSDDEATVPDAANGAKADSAKTDAKANEEAVKEEDVDDDDDDLLRAEALYGFEARNETEISFAKGDTLIVHDKDTSGWWRAELRKAGEKKRAKIGLVPSNYLRVLYKAPSFNFKLSSKVNQSIRELQRQCGFITLDDTTKAKAKTEEADQRTISTPGEREEMIASVQALLVEQRGFLDKQKELHSTRERVALEKLQQQEESDIVAGAEDKSESVAEKKNKDDDEEEKTTMMKELQWRLEKAEEVIEANHVELEMATEKEMILRLEIRSLSLESQTGRAQLELERERAAELAAQVEALTQVVREKTEEITLWRGSSRASVRLAGAASATGETPEHSESDAAKEKEREEAKAAENAKAAEMERLMEEIMMRNRQVETLEQEMRERGEVIKNLMMEVRAREEEIEAERERAARERERVEEESWWEEERKRLLGLADTAASAAPAQTATSADAEVGSTSGVPEPLVAELATVSGELAELKERARKLEEERSARTEENHITEELIRLQAQLIANMVGMVTEPTPQPQAEEHATEVRRLLEELDYLAHKRTTLVAARTETADATTATAKIGSARITGGGGSVSLGGVRSRRATTLAAQKRRTIFPVGSTPPPLPSLPSLASSLAKAAAATSAGVSASGTEDADATKGQAEVDAAAVIDEAKPPAAQRETQTAADALPPPPDGPLKRAKEEKKIRKMTAKLAKKKMEGRGVPVATGPEWVLDAQQPTCTGCGAHFTLIKRRHHCRNCGKLFCGRCTSLSCSIEELGYTEPVRVCEPCFSSLQPGDGGDSTLPPAAPPAAQSPAS